MPVRLSTMGTCKLYRRLVLKCAAHKFRIQMQQVDTWKSLFLGQGVQRTPVLFISLLFVSISSPFVRRGTVRLADVAGRYVTVLGAHAMSDSNRQTFTLLYRGVVERKDFRENFLKFGFS